MTHQIHADERVLVSATRYALGRMTYVVHDTVSQIRHAWSNISAETRAQIARTVDEAIRDAEGRGRTLGMDFDHAEWVALQIWMREHERDDAAPSAARVTMDEGMLVSAIRVELLGGDPAACELVIAETKHAWDEVSSNYRDVIARDIRSDLEMIARAPEAFDRDAEVWAELLDWIDARRT